MWGVIVLLLCVSGSREISIAKFSVPDAVESGEDALLECSYELNNNETANGLTVKWWFTPSGETDDRRHQLYQRIAGQPPATTKNDIEIKENDSILLQNVLPEDSGTYECEVSAIEDEKRQHDDLIVFAKGDMELNITEVEDGPDEDEDSEVLITCEATGVAPYPDLIITVNEEVLEFNHSDESVVRQEDDTFDVIYNVTVNRDKADGASIGCELVYKNVNITHDPYKEFLIFDLDPSALSTTEEADDASTTEATIDTRDASYGPASSLLLVAAAVVCHIFP